jgi:hypothetical protein
LLMPFKSEKQRRYLWANEPEIARDWTDTYGSGIAKALGGRIGFANGTFGPNINQILQQNRNFMVPLSSSPYQALGAWEKEGGLDSIYNKYVEASNLASDYTDKTYNVVDPYKSEGTAGDVRHVVGSSMAKDQLQNLLADYIKPGSPLAEKLTYGLGMFKTYGEELDDAIRIGKNTISGKYKGGDWDKIWSGEFLTHPGEDIAMNRIGLSIPYGATQAERLAAVPSLNRTTQGITKPGGFQENVSDPSVMQPHDFEFGDQWQTAEEDDESSNWLMRALSFLPLVGDRSRSGIFMRGLTNKYMPSGLNFKDSRFYRPATQGSYGYSPAQLNKMNALGGYYSEPARGRRRWEKRQTNILNRAATGKPVGNVNTLLGQHGYQSTPGGGLEFTGRHEGDPTAGAGYSRSDSGWSSSPFRKGGLAGLWQR